MSNISDFEIQKGVLIRYKGSESEVTIPAGVTKIGERAFSGNISLTSVTISEGVKSIGSQAFEQCNNLKNITIPKSVISIGYNAFYDRGFGGAPVTTKNVYVGDGVGDRKGEEEHGRKREGGH